MHELTVLRMLTAAAVCRLSFVRAVYVVVHEYPVMIIFCRGDSMLQVRKSVGFIGGAKLSVVV